MSFTRWLQDPRYARRRHWFRRAAHRLRLEVLEARLTPSFSPAVSYPVGPSPRAVVTGDFNSDGRLDLATMNAGGNTVSVRLGNGQGGFGVANHFATGTGPVSMAVGDFDNDGHLDVATVNDESPNWDDFTETMSVLLGNGDGTFRPFVDTAIWGRALAVAAGDFNGDGTTDLTYTQWNMDYGAVTVLLGDGQGGFVESCFVELSGAHYYPMYSIGLAVADLNADGRSDVVTANHYDHTVSVLLGDGAGALSYDWTYGSISSSNFATGSFPRAVTVGDFTGDGIPDLVTAGGTVDVLPGFGDGTFGPPLQHSATGSGLTTADFDADGHLDVVTAGSGAGAVGVLLGRGDGTFTPPLDHAAGSSPRAVAVGDFNGDGRPDVAAADAGSNAVAVLINNGGWPGLNTPLVQIRDVTVTEGNTGTVAAVFTVTLSAAGTEPVTVAYATANGTATAGSDYQATSGTLTFAPGQTSRTVTVLVTGDRVAEPNEAFFVNLSSPTNATIADGQGVGTVVDDEPRISVADVSKAEGKKGQTILFTFTVTLSAAYDQAVTVSYHTVNGTAKSGEDYIANSGTLTFAPGETTKTVTIEVKGDSKREANETFYLDLLSDSGNSLFAKNRALGTILNDD